MFIVDAKPLNSEVELLVRDNNRTKTIRTKQRIPYFTGRLKKEKLEQYRDALRDFEPSAPFEYEELGSGRFYVLRLYSDVDISKEINDHMRRKRLPPLHVKSGDNSYNYTELTRWKFPPLAELGVGTDRLGREDNEVVLGYADLDEVAKEKRLTFDIEVKDFKTDPEVYMISSLCDEEAHIFTTLDVPEFQFMYNGVNPRIHKFSNEKGMVKAFSDYIREEDPLYLCGHNIMNYDLLQLRESGVFKPGVDGSEPKIKGRPNPENPEFGRKVTVRGRYVIDTFPYASNNLWLPNNKLDTVAGYLGIGVGGERSKDYDEMQELAEIASANKGRKEGRDAALELATINIRDVLVSDELAVFMIPHILRDAVDFRTDPTTACYKSNLSRSYYDYKYFFDLNTFRKSRDLELSGFKEYSIKEKFAMQFKEKRGVYDAYLYFLPLIYDSFGEVLHNLHTSALPGSDPISKVITLKKIEQAFDERLYDMEQVPKNLPESVYRGRHGENSWVSKDNLASIEEFYKDIIGDSFINHKRGFLLSSKPLQHFPELGHGKAISMGRGQFLFKHNDFLLAFGVDPYLRQDMKTDFERELFMNLIETGMAGTEEDVKALVKKETARLRRGEVDRDKLIFRVKPGLDYDVYSYSQRTQDRIRIIQEERLKRGEEREYGVLLKKGRKRDTSIRVPPEEFLAKDGGQISAKHYLSKIFHFSRTRDLLNTLLPDEDINKLIREPTLFD